MIRLVEREQDQRRLLALCEKTAFGCKIPPLGLPPMDLIKALPAFGWIQKRMWCSALRMV